MQLVNDLLIDVGPRRQHLFIALLIRLLQGPCVRVDGWEFAVADYKAKQFKKRLSDFLNMQE